MNSSDLNHQQEQSNTQTDYNSDSSANSSVDHQHMPTPSNKRDRDAASSNTLDNNKKMKIMTALLSTMCFAVVFLETQFLDELQESHNRSCAASTRRMKYDRKTWTALNSNLSDRLFFRLFRMTRSCFEELCNKIESAIGSKYFKSELYLEVLEKQGTVTPEGRMYNAIQYSSGRYIQGEIKVAIALRYLAGASYLDLFLAFEISPNHIIDIVRKVISNWFCHDKLKPINIYNDVLCNPEKLESITTDFAMSSDGILKGCFGAIDGWLVKIKCPRMDEVPNPGKYMSRKGFFHLMCR